MTNKPAPAPAEHKPSVEPVGKLAMVAASSAGKAGGEAPAAEGAGLRIKKPGAGKSRLGAEPSAPVLSDADADADLPDSSGSTPTETPQPSAQAPESDSASPTESGSPFQTAPSDSVPPHGEAWKLAQATVESGVSAPAASAAEGVIAAAPAGASALGWLIPVMVPVVIAGAASGGGASASKDTTAPTLAISSSSAHLSSGQTATITFTFSEAPSGFGASDISTSGGALSGLAVSANPCVYTATFTPTAGTDAGAASITVSSGAYADAAGNPGGAGTTPTLTFDTSAPVIQSLTASSSAHTVTLTYDGALDPANPPLAANFTVTSGGVDKPVTLVTVLGSVVTLSVPSLVAPGNITVAYADPTSGDDASAIQDAAGNDAIGFSLARVADGYIRGATVVIDTDGDGTGDVFIGTTNADGSFFIPAGTPTGTIIATGGINMDTGVANTVSLKAPAGSTTINPLTTLVQSVVEASGATPAAAAASVARSLGLTLTAGQDLLSYDPIASNNVAAQKAAAQIATLVALAEGGLAGAGSSVMSNLATVFSPATVGGNTVDLADAGTITSMLAGIALDTSVQSAISVASAAISGSATIADVSRAQSQALDLTAPVAPSAISAAASTNDTTPTVRLTFNITAIDGTAAVAGDIITLQDSNVQVGTTYTLAAADIAAGYIDVDVVPSAALAEGAHSLTATLTDQAGNTSLASVSASVTVDTTAPAAPTISVVAGDGVLSSAEQTSSISGTAEAGATVSLSIAGLVRSATALSGGSWSYTLTAADVTAMGEGAESLTATATDAAGNTSESSAPRSLTVDTIAPTVTAALSGAADDVTPIVGNLAAGGTTNDNTLTLSGFVSAELAPGDVVAVYDGDTRLGLATVSGTAWTFATEGLANAAHSFDARVEDASGNQGSPGSTYAFTVNASAPTATVTLIAPRVTNAAAPGLSGVVSGVLANDETVRVYDGSTYLGDAALEDAAWSYTPDGLSEGSHSFRAVVQNAGGNRGTASATSSTHIDTVVPAQTVDSVALYADTGTTAGDQITSAAAQTISATLSAALDIGDILYGSVDGGNTWVDITSMASGTTIGWADAILSGSSSIVFKITDLAGNTGDSTGSTNYVLDTAAPSVSSVTDSTAADLATSAIRFTVTFDEAMVGTPGTSNFTATNGTVTSVDQVGSSNVYTVVVAPTAGVASGTVALSLVGADLADAAGNAVASADLSVKDSQGIDTLVPTAHFNAVNNSLGQLLGAGPTTSQTLLLSGTNEEGASVSVYNGSTLLGQATVTGTNWSYSVSAGNGESYGLKITEMDLAGNVSAPKAYLAGAGDAVIDLGVGNDGKDYGQLIAPVQVDGGKWFYHWDRNGNDDSSDDYIPRYELNAIFNADSKGVTGPATTDTYRYATLNGNLLALPTYGVSTEELRVWLNTKSEQVESDNGWHHMLPPGTAVGSANQAEGDNSANQTYDGLLAIWDAYNGTAQTPLAPMKDWSAAPDGRPSGWGNPWAEYASATPDPNSDYTDRHLTLPLAGGWYSSQYDGMDQEGQRNAFYVALEAFEPRIVIDTRGAPVMAGDATASVQEGATGTVYTASATQAGSTLTYALGGADAALFDINANTGAVTFLNAPDFEAPGDVGRDNVYNVDVTASNGVYTSLPKAVAITVGNVYEAPVVVTGASWATAFDEGALSSKLHIDVPNPALASVVLDTANGQLDFSARGIYGLDAYYYRDDAPIVWADLPEVQLGQSWSVQTRVSINDGLAEPQQSAGIVFYDADGGVPNFYFALTKWIQATYSLSSVAGVALQSGSGNGISGEAYSLLAPEASDAYLKVQVTERGLADHYQFFYKGLLADPWIAVGDARTYTSKGNDARVGLFYKTNQVTAGVAFDDFAITVPVSVAENSTGTVYTANATADGGNTLTYALSGTDSALFSIHANTGALAFKAAPNFEAPLDNDGDNLYDLTVTASDGVTTSVPQSVVIAVTNVVERSAVGVTVAPAQVAEGDADKLVYTFTRSHDLDGELTVNIGVTGTAGNEDYARPLQSQWTRLIGASRYETIGSAATGANGEVYVAGRTNSPILDGKNVLTQYGGGYLSKFDADGTLVWSRLADAVNDNFPYSVTTGTDGGVYVAGMAYNPGAYYDGFVTKFDAAGALAWTSFVGGPDYDYIKSVSTDANGAVYVAGLSYDANSIASSFLSKLETNGTLAWTRPVGGSNSDAVNSVSADAAGAVYVTGYSNRTILDGTNVLGESGSYVSKFDAAGNSVWTRLPVASDNSLANSVSTGADGAVYVAGYSYGNILNGDESEGGQDGFVTKFDANGNLAWTHLVGGSGDDSVKSVFAGADGAVYVAGETKSRLNGQANQVEFDGFVVKIDADGTLAWPHLIGGSGNDSVKSVSAGADGAVYVAGETYSSSLDGQKNQGNVAGFVSKIQFASLTQITFAAGSATATLALTATADTETEDAEAVTVTVLAGQGYSIGSSASATGTIEENLPPAITSANTVSVAENTSGSVYTVIATDANAGSTLAYALDGTDAGLFNIVAATGAVTFKAAPNYEAPDDAGGNNVYNITVTASDGVNTSAAQAVAITVTNVDATVNVAVTAGLITTPLNFGLSTNGSIDGAQSVYLIPVDGFASAIGQDVLTWSFASGNFGGDRSITPLLFEKVGEDYVLRAIGSTQQAQGNTVYQDLSFNVLVGDASIKNADYIFGWKDGTQTQGNEGVIANVSGSPGLWISRQQGQAITEQNINLPVDFSVRYDTTNGGRDYQFSVNTGITKDLPVVTEGDAAQLFYNFTRSGDIDGPLTVSFEKGGTATANDYAPSLSEITFAAGSSTATLALSARADRLTDIDETLTVTVVPGQGYSLGLLASATGTIQNKLPTVSTVTESTSATVTKDPITFTVTFSEALTGTVITSNFTASSGSVTSVARVDTSNVYSVVVTPTAGLASGSVALSLVGTGLTDAAGNQVADVDLSGLATQAIDTLSPMATFTAVKNSLGGVLSAGLTNSASLELSGSNEAGASVSVYNGSTLLGQADVIGGKWSYSVTTTHGITYDLQAQETDAAGNVGPLKAYFAGAGDAVIDLGEGNGQLIAPVQVDGGKWFYHWDVSGDGTAFDKDANKYSADHVLGWKLHDIFNKDVNGVQGPGTSDTYRYATLNGVHLALPTIGLKDDVVATFTNHGNADGPMVVATLVGTSYEVTGISGIAYTEQTGSAIGSLNPSVGDNTINPLYDGLLAIWDAYNGNGSTESWRYNQFGTGWGDKPNISGMPSGWSSQGSPSYASASHNYVLGWKGFERYYELDLSSGTIMGNGEGARDSDSNKFMVALEVLGRSVIVVDMQAPAVSTVADATSVGTTKDPISFTVTFDEALVGTPSTSNFTATNGTVTSVAQVGSSNVYTVVVAPTVGLASGNVALSLVGTGLADAAGNAVSSISLSGLDSQAIDTLAPSLQSSHAPSTSLTTLAGDAGNSEGETITLTLTFDGNVNGLTSGSNSTVFTVAGTGVSATWAGADGTSTRTLTYTIQAGDSGQAAIDEAPLKSALRAGITDAAGNAFTYSGSMANIDSTPLPNFETFTLRIDSPNLAESVDENIASGALVYTATSPQQGITFTLNQAAATRGDASTITQTSTSRVTDTLGEGVTLTRGTTGPMVSNTLEDGSPTIEWNSDGWAHLGNVAGRSYTSFSGALHGAVGDYILPAELVIHDRVNGTYYTVDFTQYQGGGSGGAFSYVRSQIALSAENNFDINDQGEVSLIVSPDYESRSAYEFTVIASDAQGHSVQKTVSLAINNRDEIAPEITSGNTARTLVVGTGADQLVYTATSDDSGGISTGPVTYSLAAPTQAVLGDAITVSLPSKSFYRGMDYTDVIAEGVVGFSRGIIRPGFAVTAEWNADGWDDLDRVAQRAYDIDMPDNRDSLVMHDIFADRYYKLDFGAQEGGYLRTEILADGVMSSVVNTVSLETLTTTGDAIRAGLILEVPVGSTSAIDSLSVASTLEWNAEGWDNLAEVADRTFVTAMQDALPLDEWGDRVRLGDGVVGADWVMHDTVNDTYYTVDFSKWSKGEVARDVVGGGGGFAYERQQIDLSGEAPVLREAVAVYAPDGMHAPVDEFDSGVALTRFWAQPLQGVQTVEWNADGWGNDLTDVASRNYTTNMSLAVMLDPDNYDSLGDVVLDRQWLMHDLVNDTYYQLQFQDWQQDDGGSFAYARSQIGGGNFAYTRSQIDVQTGELLNTVEFTKSAETPFDLVDTGVVISRGMQSPLNSSGVEWNGDGWSNLEDVASRDFDTNISDVRPPDFWDNRDWTDTQFVMHDLLSDRYYKIDLTDWQQGSGGAVSYVRSEIIQQLGETGLTMGDFAIDPVTGEVRLLVAPLPANSPYHLIVVATDAAGNVSSKEVELVVQPNYAPVFGTTGLVAYWQMNEGTGTVALDSGPNGLDANLMSGAGWANTGAPGFATDSSVSLNNDYLQVADSQLFNLSSGFTISAWAKPSDGTDNVIIDRGENNLNVSIRPNGEPGLGFYIKEEFSWLTSETPIDANKWVHVAVSWDPAIRAIKFYKDGVLTDTYSNIQTLDFGVGELNIGRQNPYYSNQSGSPEQEMNGQLDEVAIFDRPLSVSEISSLMQGGWQTGAVAFADHGDGVAYQAAATDANAGTVLTYGLLDSTDADLFTIDTATGAVRFKVAPDMADPLDDGGDNIHNLTVTASDGVNTSTELAVSIEVLVPPSIAATASANFEENATGVVYTAQAAGSHLTYSLAGADAALFAIDVGTRELRFVNAPDFENPLDAGHNNVYDVVVVVANTYNLQVSQQVHVTVSNVDATVNVAVSAGLTTTPINFGLSTSGGVDGFQSVYLIPVDGFASAIGQDVLSWSFASGSFDGDRSITPLLFEKVSNAYVLRAIGSTQLAEGNTVYEDLAFNLLAGDATIANANYVFGWKDGTQTLDNEGVISSVNGSPGYWTSQYSDGQDITAQNIGSNISFREQFEGRDYQFSVNTGITKDLPSVTEGDAAQLIYTFTRTGDIDGALTVNIGMGGTATAADYVMAPWTQLIGGAGDESVKSVSTAADGAVYLAGCTSSDLDGQHNQGGYDSFVSKLNADGTPAWTQLIGGSGDDESAKSVSTAADGAIYLAGYTNSDLNGQHNQGDHDGFVSKLAADGTPVWTQLIGGPGDDFVNSVYTGANGAVYAAGYTTGDLDGQHNQGGYDGFVSKLTADGTPAWTQLIGGSGDDFVNSVSIAADGIVYLAGDTTGDLDGQHNHGSYDGFVSKLNADGTPAWTQLIGGSGDDFVNSVSTGANGAVYVAGYTAGELDGQHNHGGSDGFVSKLNADGTPAWTQLVGGSGDDLVTSVSTGADGAVYLAGLTANGDLDGQTNHGGWDGFVSKLSANGAPLWTQLIGSSVEDVTSVSTGADGAVYVTGRTNGDLDGQHNHGGSDGFVVKLNADGTTPQITFAAGSSTATLAVHATADQLTEGNESVTVTVLAGQGYSLGTTLVATGTIEDNPPPVFTSAASASVPENTTGTVYTATATDANAGSTLIYAISGTDADLFTIDASTGAVTFAASPNFEAPLDAGADNVYNISVTASDGVNTSVAQDVAITVGNVVASVEVAVSPGSVLEGDAASLVYTFTRSGDIDGALTVNIGMGGTATAADYSATSDQLSNQRWMQLIDGAGSGSVSVAIDTNGSVYATGTTYGSMGEQINAGESAAFITRFATNGTREWTRLVGGTASEQGNLVTTGPDGVVYLIGFTYGDIGDQVSNGNTDAFITQFAADGSAQWTQLVGGTGYDISYSAFASADGAVYVGGYGNASIDAQPYNDNNDAFITKFSANGEKLWTRMVGGHEQNIGFSIAGGSSDGSFYLAGYTNGAMDSQTYAGGDGDAFIAKYDVDGNALWTRLVGGTSTDKGQSIAIGSDGAVYMTGSYDGYVWGIEHFQTPGGFVVKYDADGNQEWIHLLGAPSGDGFYSLTTDGTGSIYVEGTTYGDIDGQTNNGGNDAFIVKYDSDGTKQWTQLIGGTGDDHGRSVSASADGSLLYLAGYTNGSADGASYNGFVTQLSATPSSLTFAAGSSTATLAVHATADQLTEGNESVTVTVLAGQGYSLGATLVATVATGTIEDNPPPVINSAASASVPENTTGTVYTATATDANAGSTLTYAISGTDAARFTINTSTGAVAFATAPNFETPLDDGGHNVYNISVTASDGLNTSVAHDVAITVGNANEAPVNHLSFVGNLGGLEWTTVGAYSVHRFTDVGSSTLTVAADQTIHMEALLVAGGAAGAWSGNMVGAGGGGGGVAYIPGFDISNATYTITVGAGVVAEGNQGHPYADPRYNGGNSSLASTVGQSVTVYGGGVGGGNSGDNGSPGGSGGGGHWSSGQGGAALPGTATGIYGVVFYGNAGGQSDHNTTAGGGGGGATSAGANATSGGGGNGGEGLVSDITGTAVVYGSGGGGGGNNSSGVGGTNGGNATTNSAQATSGVTNTGGGGGGSGGSLNGSGGSGIVVLRYIAGIAAEANTPHAITGIQIGDPEATDNFTVTFTQTHGVLAVAADVANGLAGSGISGNNSGSVSLSGTLAQINTTLAASNGLVLTMDSSFSGSAALTMTTTDSQGATDTDVTAVTVAAAPTIPPTLSSTDAAVVTGTPGDSANETMVLTLTFDGPVNGLTSGADSTIFTVGSSGESASWSGSNGSNTRTLTYTISDGQNGQAAINEGALKTALVAGITDASGNAFAYSGNIPNIDASALPVVDTLAPTLGGTAPSTAMTTIAGTAGNSAGETIALTLTFDGPVNGLTSGTNSTIFTVGGSGESASWAGSGSTRTLTYTISVGQNGQAAIDETALKAALQTGITDASGNAFAYNGNIPNIDTSALPVVDTSAPTATLTTDSLDNTASAVVQSSEVGTAYLVKTSVSVGSVADITGASDTAWKSAAISAAGSDTSLALAGLVDGTYKLYTVDAAGNLSAASSSNLIVDTTAPSFSSSASANFTENGSGTVMDVNASDNGGATDGGITYSKSGTDAAQFALNSSTGALSLASSPNHEAPTDSGGNNVYELSVTATDAAGNTSTQAVAVTVTDVVDLGQSVISLGSSYGNLIAPVQVEGKWYYHWDRNGDGTNGGIDEATHDVLDGIFTQDINGVTGGAGHTTDTYRYATLNGVQVALPTANGGVAYPNGINFQNGTAYTDAGVSTNGSTSSFDELLAIWDAYNGTGTGTDISGTPTGWRASDYWSATPSASGHAYVLLYRGYVGDYFDSGIRFVALQVLSDTLAPTVASVAISSATNSQNSTLTAGDVVSVTVTMSEATTVGTSGGTPQLALNIGGSTVQAAYASGSGSSALVFTYTVLANQTDTDGISIGANSLTLNGGTLSDAWGNAATLTQVLVADNAGYLVDTTAPSLSSSASANFTENASGTVMDVNASDNGGATDIGITYSKSGTDAAQFTLNSSTGALSFASSPNYEAPTDSGGNNVYELSVTATDAAGNTSTQAVAVTVTDVVESLAGQSVIDLGSYGKLIAPVQVDGGKWYYYWDRSGDGTNAGADGSDHDLLDQIFNYDSNGDQNPGADTTDQYRYATLNGVKLALPTIGVQGGASEIHTYAGTTIGNAQKTPGSNALNETYDDFMAIWDAYNGVGTTTEDSSVNWGMPTTWAPGHYWASGLGTGTPATHAFLDLNHGYAYAVGGADSDATVPRLGDFGYVALQVL